MAVGKRSGFTLVELLVAITIMSLLVALQVPAVARVQFEARKIECLSYKRQLITYYYTETWFEDGAPPYTIQPLMEAAVPLSNKCYSCHNITR